MASGSQPSCSSPNSLLKCPERHRNKKECSPQPWKLWLSESLLPRFRGVSLREQQRWRQWRKAFCAYPRVFLSQKPLVYFSQKAGYPSSYFESLLHAMKLVCSMPQRFPIHPSFFLHWPQQLHKTNRVEKRRDFFPFLEMNDVSVHPGKCSSINSALRWVQEVRFMAEALYVSGL